MRVSLSTVQMLLSDDQSRQGIRVNCHYRWVHILYTRRDDDWLRGSRVWHTAEYDDGVTYYLSKSVSARWSYLAAIIIHRDVEVDGHGENNSCHRFA